MAGKWLLLEEGKKKDLLSLDSFGESHSTEL